MTSGEGLLVLVRHGQSTDNEHNLFSGWRDPDLTSQGVAEARAAGFKLREEALRFDVAFTSVLTRARRSFELMRDALGQHDLAVHASAALNERDYGELSGLNKEEAREVWGSEQVHLWRKSYRAVPPAGESLAMTAERTVPFYRRDLEPRLKAGGHVLVVAHGNSLRSIVKYLDQLTDDDVVSVHIATSQILIYRIAEDGTVLSKRSILATS
jgi:2,3-bisphosphoglycerate-dependent phosphoglycerate mutase